MLPIMTMAPFICEVKEGSKFLATCLQVGSRIVAINGEPVPDCTSQVLKIINNAERELEMAEKPDPRIQPFLVAVCEDKSVATGVLGLESLAVGVCY